jgi:thiol-disulfide isomerase/thioredoxin
MRVSVVAGALLLGLTACSAADDKGKAAVAEKANEPQPLKVGDAAPAIKGAKYLTGSAITSYAPGQVYVIEFWATWCGPCIQAMPHLAEIQSEFKAQGLTVIGVTTKDPNNSAEKVAEFVEKKGKKLGYAFAFCETEETYDAFMKAAGQDGIPCSFVVDKAGKVAYIGHPMELDDVLPKVVAGTWRGQADLDEIKKADDEFGDIMRRARTDPADAVKKLDEYAAKYPTRAKQELFNVRKLVLQMQAKQFDAAKAATETLIAKGIEKKSSSLLGNLSAVWAAEQLNPDKKFIELAVAAADGLLKVEGETELGAVAQAAEVYFAAGKKEKAIEYAEKALKLATVQQEKQFLEDMIKKFKGEKVEPKAPPAKP